MIAISIDKLLAQKIMFALQGSCADKIELDDKMLLKKGSEEQAAAAVEKLPLGNFKSLGGETYILYNK
jgi:hypothetical protein